MPLNAAFAIYYFVTLHIKEPGYFAFAGQPQTFVRVCIFPLLYTSLGFRTIFPSPFSQTAKIFSKTSLGFNLPDRELPVKLGHLFYFGDLACNAKLLFVFPPHLCLHGFNPILPAKRRGRRRDKKFTAKQRPNSS